MCDHCMLGMQGLHARVCCTPRVICLMQLPIITLVQSGCVHMSHTLFALLGCCYVRPCFFASCFAVVLRVPANASQPFLTYSMTLPCCTVALTCLPCLAHSWQVSSTPKGLSFNRASGHTSSTRRSVRASPIKVSRSPSNCASNAALPSATASADCCNAVS